MASSDLKTILWIDRNPMRRLLVKDLCSTEGIEAFLHEDLSELSVSIIESMAPSLIIVEEELGKDFQEMISEVQLQAKVTVMGEESELKLPLEPRSLISKLQKLLV